MKSITVLSGKGGVGKSTIVASLAISLSKEKKIVCADCDVDASNLSLLFSLKEENYFEWKKISTNKAPEVDYTKCIKCRRCKEICYFDSINFTSGFPEIDMTRCEGCGACVIACEKKALSLIEIFNAKIGYSRTKHGFLIASAQIEPGHSGSGKIVYEVKKKAEKISPDADLLLIDSGAGIGCPVIASISGSDYSIVVCEPTPSSISDLKRAIKLVNHFKIKKGIIINKSDLNNSLKEEIEKYAKSEKIKILAKIPFDKDFINAMTKMIPIIEFKPQYSKIFEKIKQKINNY